MKLVTANDIAGDEYEDRLLAALAANMAIEATAAEHARLWDELATAYLFAKSAADHNWNDVIVPALDSPGRIDPATDAAHDRLREIEDEAEDRLFACPSPHGQALALKCLAAMDQGRDASSLRAAVLEDARQLYQRGNAADRQPSGDKLAAAWIAWRDAARIQLRCGPDNAETDAAEDRLDTATDVLYGTRPETLSGVIAKLRIAFAACDDTREGEEAAVESDEAIIAYGREKGGNPGLIADAIDFLLKMEAAHA